MQTKLSRLLLAGLIALIFAGCSSVQERNAKRARKEPGTVEWYAERHRKRKTEFKDKREKMNPDYTRDTETKRNPGTGLNVPPIKL